MLHNPPSPWQPYLQHLHYISASAIAIMKCILGYMPRPQKSTLMHPWWNGQDNSTSRVFGICIGIWYLSVRGEIRTHASHSPLIMEALSQFVFNFITGFFFPTHHKKLPLSSLLTSFSPLISQDEFFLMTLFSVHRRHVLCFHVLSCASFFLSSPALLFSPVSLIDFPVPCSLFLTAFFWGVSLCSSLSPAVAVILFPGFMLCASLGLTT